MNGYEELNLRVANHRIHMDLRYSKLRVWNEKAIRLVDLLALNGSDCILMYLSTVIRSGILPGNTILDSKVYI